MHKLTDYASIILRIIGFQKQEYYANVNTIWGLWE